MVEKCCSTVFLICLSEDYVHAPPSPAKVGKGGGIALLAQQLMSVLQQVERIH